MPKRELQERRNMHQTMTVMSTSARDIGNDSLQYMTKLSEINQRQKAIFEHNLKRILSENASTR